VLKLAQLARELVATETARLRLGLFRVASALLMLSVAAVILLIGTVFLLSGIYQSLVKVTSAWQAGGIITLVTLVVAAGLAFWARRRLSVGRRPPAADRPPVSEVAEQFRQATERGINAGEELKRGLRPIDLALSAFIAGMIVSRSSRAASQRRKGKDDSGP
jgi:type VI protein secretion system component VasK